MDKWFELSQPIQIKPGDSCQVLIGDEPVITGYVDRVAPAISADDHSVNISGRDKTCDLVDCSATIDTYDTIGLDLSSLARLICESFDGIFVKVETNPGPVFNRFAVQPGETAFACLDRAAKLRGVLLTTNGEGQLVLSAKGVFERSNDALIYGKNIKSASAEYDWRNRFQTYKVNGQVPSFDDGETDPKTDEIGEARDVNVMRKRPLILTAESWSDEAACRTRAENECCCRTGNSERVNVQVAGWRQSNGQLWKPGLLVAVALTALYIPGGMEFVIATVRYTFSDSDRTVAELELKRPDAFLETQTGKVGEDEIDFSD
jgi:prophage tail gpP-like protein